ncbi:sulfotransferase [Kordiimonas lipolytica]|uniref:Sulfotransferase n=1 Tax=Kordiimonas lipolytica TaxID=1662421 RepID=A0ABV8UBN8_9PROT|nr:sulfotransferase [Kordiimonas lipolytica]
MTDKRQHHQARISQAQQQGKSKAIEAAFAAALKDMPEDPVLLAQWAEYQFGLGEKKSARRALLHAYSLVPEGQHHLKMGLCDKMFCLELQTDAFKLLPPIAPQERAVETLVRIKILRHHQDDIGVRKACQHLIAHATLPHERWSQISALLLASGHPGAAIEAFRKSIRDSGATPAELNRLVALHIENDDLESAWEVLEEMPEEARQAPSMLSALAQCQRKRGNKDEAIEAYRRLLDHAPANTAVWSGLADLSEKADLPGLVARCQTVLKDEKIPDAEAMLLWYSLARMQDRLKLTSDAFQSYHRANDMMHAYYVSENRAYDTIKVEQTRERLMEWFRAEMFGPQQRDQGRDQPIFVVGMPRSGTTLLERILASLPNVKPGGESKALARIASDHHQEALRGAAPLPQDIDPQQWQTFADDYWANTRVHGRFVTDKLPQNYRNLGWGMKMFPCAPIIYLKRDPRDIGWSLYKRAFRSAFAYTVQQEFIAHAIKQCEAYMAHWRRVAPGRILTVQYEELVQNPEEVTREIADFCGVEWTPACLSPEKLDVPTFTLSEQQVREPINAKGLGRWKDYEEFLQPMIRALEGYGLVT